MVRLLLLLVAAPAALGLENVNFLPHNRHGHHLKKHEHLAHRAHAHSHESKLKAEATPEVIKMAKPAALEASTPTVTSTAAATPEATPAATTTPVAKAEIATTPAATTPAVTTAAATTTPVPAVDVPTPSLKDETPVLEVQPVDDSANSASVGKSQLQVDLVEMKQNKVHITQLEQALHEDASLLRESSTLEHVSHSKRGHASAARQVKQAAQLVKGTEAMLMESRADAVEKSKAMIREAAASREAADSLSAEAAEELKLFASGQSHESAQPALREPVATPVTKPAEASSEEDIDIEDEN